MSQPIRQLQDHINASIYDSATLAALHIRCITRTGKSAKGTQAVEDRYGVIDVGSFRLERLSKEQFRPISTAQADLRAFHREHTLRYPLPGYGILPGRMYHEYMAGIQERIARFDAAADQLCADWQAIVNDAQQRLGELFDPTEYPEAGRIRALLSAEVKIEALPRPENISLRLPEEELARIRQDAEASLQESIQGAVSDLAERLRESVGYLHERLREPDSIFRDSTVQNVLDLVELLPRLNVTGDPKIEQFVADTRKALAGTTTDTLRRDMPTRRRVADEAEALLEGLDDYISGMSATAH